MPHFKYGYQGIDENTARAQLYNVDVSWKQLTAVCHAIVGMDAEVATVYLEKVKNMEMAVRFVKHCKYMGHRRELGGARGRYPQKAAGYVLQVLKNAVANAGSKGILSPVVIHASATYQSKYPRMQSKGRRSRGDYETSRIEMVVGEMAIVQEEKVKEEKKEVAKVIAKKEIKTEKMIEKKAEKVEAEGKKAEKKEDKK